MNGGIRVDADTAATTVPGLFVAGEVAGGLQGEPQETMQSLVGIIRTGRELEQALTRLDDYRKRLATVQSRGGRTYNPGWHTALDLHALLTVSEAVTRAAIHRKESRGGHTRTDYPSADPAFARTNVVVRMRGDEITTSLEPIPQVPSAMKKLLDV